MYIPSYKVSEGAGVSAKSATVSVSNIGGGADFMAALNKIWQEPQRVVVDMTTKEQITLGDFGTIETGTSASYMAISIYLQQMQNAFSSAFDTLVLQYKTWPQEVARMMG
jgi:hypothetical protein